MRRKPGALVPLEVSILESGIAFLSQGEGDFHGYQLAKEMKQRLGARFRAAYGTLYRALDRMEQAGLLRRLPDPGDRRRVVVELTEHGRETYRRTVGVQAQKEALFAAALSDREKIQLNRLLRQLMIEFERREGSRPPDEC